MVEEYNLEEAIVLLKKGLIMRSVKDDNVSYFIYNRRNKFHIVSDNMSLQIDEERLIELFSQASFSSYTVEGPEIDLLKDEEYYSWRSK